ncbi:MAG: hypothetical protein LC640_04790 [Frankia sp.]|nr:hypothetical protein [Frankia sp.]
MWQSAAGHRVLIAPNAEIANFVGATYRFDETRVCAVTVHRTVSGWLVAAGDLRLALTPGRRDVLGWTLRAVPAVVRRRPQWAQLTDLIARRLLPGVQTIGRAPDGRRQWYAARDHRPLRQARAWLGGKDLGPLRDVARVDFGFSAFPRRPAIVHCTSYIEDLPRTPVGVERRVADSGP